jgi:SAM-dependent methyltransferase
MASASIAWQQLVIRTVCPACRGPLHHSCEAMSCTACGARYPVVGGFADLIVGDRYDDDTPECAVENEEATNRETVDRYWIPFFQRLWPRGAAGRKILSLGCGVGADVERLVDAGFDAIGIDNGKRAGLWARRRCSGRLIHCNGKHMPFEDATFDLIFCGCVFPHVGVIGTSFDTTEDCYEQRLKLAGEMARVLKPGGRIVTCNPNRYFPFDIFHGHQAGRVTLRPTMPWSRLLLSRGDYFRMFQRFGCVHATAMPVENYWSFTNSRQTWKGRMLAAPVAFLLRVVSRIPVLRGSPLNPWLVVMLEKDARDQGIEVVRCT